MIVIFYTNQSVDFFNRHPLTFSFAKNIFGLALAAGNFNRTKQPTNAPVFSLPLAWDHFDDLAIGVPGDDMIVNGVTIVGAGAVNVIYGSPSGLSAVDIADQYWSQHSWDIPSNPATYDGFGGALAVGNFNGDGDDDLAIGVPGEDVTANTIFIENAGAVQVINGSSDGLLATGNSFWCQGFNGVNGQPEDGDRFGSNMQ